MLTKPEMPAAHATNAWPVAIRFDNVSKLYKLYPDKAARIRESFDPRGRAFHKELHALHDVSFAIARGTTVGILGVNGSGKSTLLQLVSGILQPSSGSVMVDGRIAALIELGAGFNPYLTGRENARINGVILGLTEKQVAERIGKIEAFAEVGEFFDQPVRTYSSGMLMRVAFATAINVEPEILVVDEALAVGDARFQQKCFRQFREVQDSGKTILYVTHDRFAVPRLCTHGIVLHEGRMVHFGDPKAAMEAYSEILINGAPTARSRVQAKAVQKASVEAPAQAEDTKDTSAMGGGAAEMVRAGANTVADDESARALRGAETEAGLASFLVNPADEDRCHLNPTYNKNEKRVGIGGARIIDFMIAVADTINPAHIKSGDRLAIAFRIKFEEDVPNPIVGMAIHTKDGVLAYSTNSMWLGVEMAPRKAGDVAGYRFEVDFHLGSNDWFMDLAVAKTRTELLESRTSLLTVRADPVKPSHGVAHLQAVVTDVFRSGLNEA